MKTRIVAILIVISCRAGFAQDDPVLTMDYTGDFRVNHRDVLELVEQGKQGGVSLRQAAQLVKEWGRDSAQQINPDTGLEEVKIGIPALDGETIELNMVKVPAGTFTMGAPDDEYTRLNVPGAFRNIEWRPHEVTISQDFYLGKFEVTQALWLAVMGENPSGFANDLSKPVEQVSWNNVQEFITQLNSLGVGTFRLPTEAEWEYACRARTETAFAHGTGETCLLPTARCPEHDPFMWYVGSTSGGTRPVGEKLPNPWGLHDMHGNVYEWCGDFWVNPFDRGAVTDPSIPANNDGPIFRGGGWNSPTWNCRSAGRVFDSAEFTENNLGFRLVAESVALSE